MNRHLFYVPCPVLFLARDDVIDAELGECLTMSAGFPVILPAFFLEHRDRSGSAVPNHRGLDVRPFDYRLSAKEFLTR